jgi:hypothetical protein
MEAPTTLSAELTAFNGRWLDEVRQHLAPACDPHGGFWDRWAAVRYLADQFEEPRRRAGDVLQALIDHLDMGMAGRLVDDLQAIDDLRADFDQIGRERGTAIAAAAIACSLLATLQRWCSALEHAVRTVGKENPTRAREALARLASADIGVS